MAYACRGCAATTHHPALVPHTLQAEFERQLSAPRSMRLDLERVGRAIWTEQQLA